MLRCSRLLPVLGVAGALVLVACTPGEPSDIGSATSSPSQPAKMVTVSATPGETTVLGDDSPSALAAAAAKTFFASAPVVVLAAEEQQLRGAGAAVALGVPLLVDGPEAAGELERLGTEVALVLGPVADPGIDVVVLADDAELATLVGASAPATQVGEEDAVAEVAALEPSSPELLVPATGPTTEPAAPTAPAYADTLGGLPATDRPEPVTAVAVMTTGHEDHIAAAATARAAGADVIVVPSGDPRATSETVQATAEAAPEVVIGVGTAFGDAETLAWRASVAATGVELPGGGQLVLPGKTYVALYGNPVTSALGVLGEQGPEATIERAAGHAAAYEGLTENTVVPALEIIATVASEGAGPDGNYSNEIPVSDLRPLVDLAAEHGQYVVIDLQPGRTDFVTQAELYEELLVQPHVGLALDPEWRLRPDEVHLRQIGHVDVAEVNEVVDWLADLTREHDLPQKLLVLHQFQLRMIPGVDQVDQSRSEVAVLIHADGQGPQGSKQETWRALRANAPSVQYWGWKNFYDEDSPVLTPEQTMQVEPTPDFISYQ